MLALTREITQGAEAILCSGIASDRDGIRVLEAEWWKPAEIVPLGKRPRDVIEDAARFGGERVGERIVEHGHEPRARVLRIDVDRSLAKRAEGHLRCAEAWLAYDGDATGLEQLREHLAQEVRLAERLGGDDDRSEERRVGEGVSYRKWTYRQ